MIGLAITLVGLFLVVLVALHRKDHELQQAIAKAHQAEAELRRLRGDRAGLQTDNAYLVQRNAELETLLQPNVLPKAKKITARKPRKKAVE